MLQGRKAGSGILSGIRIYLLSVAGIALLAVLLLIIFYRPSHKTGQAMPSLSVQEFPYHRILIPEDKLELIPSELMHVRPRRIRWSDEELGRYWIPPGPLIKDLLKKENERIIEDILNEIP